MTDLRDLAETSDAGLGRSVERDVVIDMVRRSLPALPVPVVVAGAFWGWAGALSAAFAIGIVLLNFALSAALLTWGARVSLRVLMIAALGGFILRLGLVTALVLAVRDQAWVDLVPLCVTLLLTHIGLLVWETRHVSTSLAFPGILPGSKARQAG